MSHYTSPLPHPPKDDPELQHARAVEDQLRAENEHLRETVLELERVRDTYFELYELAAVGLCAMDEKGQIHDVNCAAAALLGQERKSLVGTLLQLFATPEDRQRIARHLFTCQQLTSQMADVRFTLSKDAIPVRLSTRWVHTSKGASILAALLDERESVRVAVEKQHLVEAEQRARRESESKDQFIAMLSHELRTPLTPILADCSLRLEDPELTEQLRRVFARIARNAQAEARLVDDLLDATGIVRGKLSIECSPLDAHELLQECAEAVRVDAERKGQAIYVDLTATKPWVDGDALRLRQVFTNLLRNAVKFTPARGVIHLRSWDGAEHLVVEVEDSGLGFEPEMAPRLFEPFEQLNQQAGGGGLGLGLAIAKGLVELHQGTLGATSRGLGRGARFVATFPSKNTPSSLPRHASKTPFPSQPPPPEQKLLLVEDHLDTAEILSELLQLHGYTVVIANTVAGALAEDNPEIDVVISDLGLPDGTGGELIRELQARRRRPAIALSGFGMESDVRASKDAGFDLHLTKPVTADRLIGAVQSLKPSLFRYDASR